MTDILTNKHILIIYIFYYFQNCDYLGTFYYLQNFNYLYIFSEFLLFTGF